VVRRAARHGRNGARGIGCDGIFFRPKRAQRQALRRRLTLKVEAKMQFSSGAGSNGCCFSLHGTGSWACSAFAGGRRSVEEEEKIAVAKPTGACDRSDWNFTEQLRKSRRGFKRNRNSWASWWNKAAGGNSEARSCEFIFCPRSGRSRSCSEGRESLEKVRVIRARCSAGHCRVCAKLEAVAVSHSAARGASGTQDLRAQFERDPMVRPCCQRFEEEFPK